MNTTFYVRNGIARVVAGTVDPDARVSGNGIDYLRRHGIEVSVGVEEQACRDVNKAFIHRVTCGRPISIAWTRLTVDNQFEMPPFCDISDMIASCAPDTDTLVIDAKHVKLLDVCKLLPNHIGNFKYTFWQYY